MIYQPEPDILEKTNFFLLKISAKLFFVDYNPKTSIINL